MKVFALLLIAASIAFGAIAATTAYTPRLDTIDAKDGLELAADVGVVEADSGDPRDRTPLVTVVEGRTVRTVVLDEAMLQTLRDANVERVRVKSFDFARWDLWWLFALAVGGLLVGAAIIRIETRRVTAAHATTGASSAGSPEQHLAQAASLLTRLHDDLARTTGTEARIELITSRLEQVESDCLQPFVETRPMIIGRRGLAGYAQIMDRFAAAERQLYRAWSAAVDGVMEESTICIAEGRRVLDEAIERLRG
ncbi:MAG: hypothetical protein KDA25_07115 [Phycisphaerales bacterium]|nr:hypothetical protein [Phycisphaerales bacterium]